MAFGPLISGQRCLVLDPDSHLADVARGALGADGWSVRWETDLNAARGALDEGWPDLALLALEEGRDAGAGLVAVIKASQPGLPWVAVAADASIAGAVEAMRAGALDYLPRPFGPADLRRAVAQALAAKANQRRGLDLTARPLLQSQSPAMQALLSQAGRVAASDTTTVLLQGETGTGKGVLAKVIHNMSPRAQGPFVVVTCPALPLDLLESELFGHERGAFTGAYRDHEGRLAQAEGGTLFLDEVGDLPLPLQAKLLRAVQEREYERLGGSQTLRADVRIISATHVDLAKAVKEGRFREDLYYRLSAVELALPPLRDRCEDLPALIDGMLEELRQETGRGPSGVSPAAFQRFRQHGWPGNLRELRNLLERACVLGGDGPLEAEDLTGLLEVRPLPVAGGEGPVMVSMEEVEARHIARVLAATRTLEQAAKVLGIDGATLWRKRKKYGL